MYGLLKTVAASMSYLLDETEQAITQGILLEVRLELSEPEIIFQPSLDTNIVDNLYDRVRGWVDDIMHQCR